VAREGLLGPRSAQGPRPEGLKPEQDTHSAAAGVNCDGLYIPAETLEPDSVAAFCWGGRAKERLGNQRRGCAALYRQ
jgi:hypothetical protein